MHKVWRNETARAAVFLVVLLNLCFFSSIWGRTTLLASANDVSSITPQGAWMGKSVPLRFPKTLDEGAAGWQTEPWLALIGHEVYGEHVLPLWNPYQAYGTPLAANMQSQPFFPLTLLLAGHLTPWTYNIFILLRLFLAGMGGYLFCRLFVSHTAALGGGIMSMLAGYYIVYLTMPHLSVETLLPGLLWITELTLRRRSIGTLVGLAFTVALVLLGGMPESSFVAIAFAGCYAIFRVATGRDARPAITHVVIAVLLGIGLSAFLLLPFWEFTRHAYDVHQAANVGGMLNGLLHDKFGPSIFTYLFPLLFGPPTSSTLGPGDTGLRNYVGVICLFLTCIAICAIWAKQKGNPLNALTWFFFSFGLVTILKRYGFAPVNIFGTLPVLNLVWFPKYGEPVLSICAAVLSAIGIERLLRGDVSRHLRAACFAVAGLTVPVAVLCSLGPIVNEFTTVHVKPAIPIYAVAVPLFLLFCLAIACIVVSDRRLAITALGLLATEAVFSYVAPAYLIYNRLPSSASNPYQGAPFISVLKAKAKANDRIVFTDRSLFPNWASAFQLLDIRDVDALYYDKYFRFLRNFLPARIDGSSELYDRFTATAGFDVTAPLTQRLLQLSSVHVPGTVPHAAVFFHVEGQPNDLQVLARLADPAFDPTAAVVVNAAMLPRIAALAKNGPAVAEAATIRSYGSASVTFDASLPQAGIVMLTDSDYPGWTATLDGHPIKWFTVNYLFRGVLAPAGQHTVQFKYRPASFLYGSLISLASLGALIALLFIPSRRRWQLPDRLAHGQDRERPELRG